MSLPFREAVKQYEDAVVRVREKLLQLPPNIVDLAYRFRDLCEEAGDQ